MSITDAEPSQDAQLRSRQIRYATMMGLRIVCLIAATVLVGAHAPLLWLWLPLCLVGMVVLPWAAVLIANDRPPRRRLTVPRLRRPRVALPDATAAAVTAEAEFGAVIDGETATDPSGP
ncbi:DUF3099 domain-containing protein [Longispora sp. K20-0274]|uniref:DUF3099 domain-containing protein n=1 Tax=Longispora sp. K20-0274 TaxID=3088255 RepID=UPI00399AC3BB